MISNDRQNIYSNSKYRIERDIKRIQLSEKISQKNKTLVISFLTYKISDNTSHQRCKKLAIHLRQMSEIIEKDFSDFLKDDLVNLIVTMKSDETKALSTRQDYILALKQFFKWLEDEDDRLFSEDLMVRRKAMQLYKYLKNTRLTTYRKKVNPADIITEDDMKTIINYADSVRDRAFVKLLHETGARAGEFLNIKLKHIVFSEDGRAHIHLDGKTGERRIPVVFSVPYLKQYLVMHPYKEDENSFLWWTNPRSNRKAPVKHCGAAKILNRIWSKLPDDSPIKRKDHNMHFFRHSRASILAPTMSESLLCKYMGWTLSSKQAKTYVHLSPDDLDNAFFGNLGMNTKQVEEKKIVPKECEMCGTINDSKAEFCLKCGKPLSVEATVLNEDLKSKEMEKTFKVMMKMMQNPEFLEFAKKENFSF